MVIYTNGFIFLKIKKWPLTHNRPSALVYLYPSMCQQKQTFLTWPKQNDTPFIWLKPKRVKSRWKKFAKSKPIYSGLDALSAWIPKLKCRLWQTTLKRWLALERGNVGFWEPLSRSWCPMGRKQTQKRQVLLPDTEYFLFHKMLKLIKSLLCLIKMTMHGLATVRTHLRKLIVV